MTDYKINKEYLQEALELLVKIEKAKETESAFLEKGYFYQLKGYIEGGIKFLEMTLKDKNEVSPRAGALKELKEYLTKTI